MMHIPASDVWRTPGGYTHVTIYFCVMCGDVLLNPKNSTLNCPKHYPEDFPKWKTPWRPSPEEFTNGHFYEYRLLTLEFEKLPDNVVIDKEVKLVQQRLFE